MYIDSTLSIAAHLLVVQNVDSIWTELPRQTGVWGPVKYLPLWPTPNRAM
jgi:hypothetical protein